jgi:hypothetical protein
MLLNGATNTTVWSSNVTTKEVNNPIARVMDSGNLGVQNRNDSNAQLFGLHGSLMRMLALECFILGVNVCKSILKLTRIKKTQHVFCRINYIGFYF